MAFDPKGDGSAVWNDLAAKGRLSPQPSPDETGKLRIILNLQYVIICFIFSFQDLVHNLIPVFLEVLVAFINSIHISSHIFHHVGLPPTRCQ